MLICFVKIYHKIVLATTIFDSTKERISIDSFVFEYDLIKKLKEKSIESPELITSDLTEPEVILPDSLPSSQLDTKKIIEQDEGERKA